MKRFLSRRPEKPPEEDASGFELLRWTLRASAARIVEHSKDLTDPEEVHQARVGMRRFRSALHTFRGIFEPRWADEMRDIVKPLADCLGAVRDADVLHARLAGREPLVDPFRAERRRELAGAFPGFAHAVEAVVAAAAEPRVFPAAGDRALSALTPYVAPVWRRLQHAARNLGDDPTAEALHRVRILTKHARYAAEVLEPVTGKAAARFARRAADVQTVLGEVQDAAYARSWLEDASRTSDDAFARGTLAGLEIAAADRARAQWPEVWERLDKKKVVRFLTNGWTPPGDGPVVYLVRHAKAGDRAKWTQADEIRPLTKAGLREAEALVPLLKDVGVTRVASSPYTRCMQTVEPVAAAAGLPVVPEGALAEGAPLESALALLNGQAPVVLCTHGDVGENLIAHLARQGVPGADPSLCAKGSTWVIRPDRADYLPPQA